MKTSMKLILGLLLTAFSLQGFAQKPEPVYSVVRQIHDFEWYEQQAKSWKQEIDRGTKVLNEKNGTSMGNDTPLQKNDKSMLNKTDSP